MIHVITADQRKPNIILNIARRPNGLERYKR